MDYDVFENIPVPIFRLNRNIISYFFLRCAYSPRRSMTDKLVMRITRLLLAQYVANSPLLGYVGPVGWNSNPNRVILAGSPQPPGWSSSI